MPIYNGSNTLRPRFRFKPCPNCGADLKFGMSECCVTNRLKPGQYKPRVRKEIKAVVCMNPADEKKYVLVAK
jgi:hypothetical protein